MIHAEAADDARRPAWPSARLTLLVRAMALAIMLHNAEEWWTLPLVPDFLAATRDLSGLQASLPSVETTRWGIIAFAAVPVAILLRAQPGRRGGFIICMIAAMSAGNALFPHIAMGFVTGGYVPGLVTACTATLPIGILLICEARRLRLMSGSGIALASATGLLLMPAVATGFWALGALIGEITGSARLA
ncbi:HXXEE domain-containing protein [Pseudopontixanthobacter vadosimaris]|uniref:HXXEE domain-containing protein n=1 Tax=Pseudopontixanthobacter vadosimaris TaxID=2726450 RepID=UPI0014757B55